ncbi:MAG: hypothetical protein FE834_04370 [Gammaproteobacteria bacterium]|nr:hypothetical protein [Gammaproteobacteria bacterium]
MGLPTQDLKEPSFFILIKIRYSPKNINIIPTKYLSSFKKINPFLNSPVKITLTPKRIDKIDIIFIQDNKNFIIALKILLGYLLMPAL